MRVKQGFVRSSDGTRIAYQVIGSGRPLFCCNGLGVSPYFWRHLVAYFGNQYQIITWEYRGHGRSAASPDPYHLRYADFIADARAVIEGLDLRRIVGIGHSAGFQVLLGLYEQMPKRFAAMASFLGTAGNALRFFFDWPGSRLLFDLLYIVSVFWPGQVRLMLDLLCRTPIPYQLAGALNILTPGLADKEDIAHYLSYIRAMDPRFFATLTQGAEAHTAYRVLRRIRIPTLVIAGAQDRFVPLRIARRMAAAIRGTEWFLITRGTHAALMEVPDVLNLRLEQFLQHHRLA